MGSHLVSGMLKTRQGRENSSNLASAQITKQTQKKKMETISRSIEKQMKKSNTQHNFRNPTIGGVYLTRERERERGAESHFVIQNRKLPLERKSRKAWPEWAC